LPEYARFTTRDCTLRQMYPASAIKIIFRMTASSVNTAAKAALAIYDCPPRPRFRSVQAQNHPCRKRLFAEIFDSKQ